MATTYTETPNNYNAIELFVKSDDKDIKKAFISAERVLFYDTCSFQRHSGLSDREQSILINYYKVHDTMICITRCVLMELSSDYHILPKEYVDFIKNLYDAGVVVAIFNEEYTFDILSECFATNEKINEYLVWAVRTVKSPVSTIEYTLKVDKKLYSDVIEGKNLRRSDLYIRFFSAVRGNKEHSDNLGEELIAICIHILSYLVGVKDGKLCVLTDDKGAAGKIDSVIRRTNSKNRGAKIMLFSTPKLVQHMYQEKITMSEEEMENIISKGTSGKIVVMGMTAFNLSIEDKISMTSRELVQKIMEPNGITIVF